jgi:hypothetical protein
MAAASDTDASKTVDSPIASASESDVEDSKPEISEARADSANSKKKKKKKKKKRKSATRQKKSWCVSSASAVLSDSRKQTNGRKLLRA